MDSSEVKTLTVTIADCSPAAYLFINAAFALIRIRPDLHFTDVSIEFSTYILPFYVLAINKHQTNPYYDEYRIPAIIHTPNVINTKMLVNNKDYACKTMFAMWYEDMPMLLCPINVREMTIRRFNAFPAYEFLCDKSNFKDKLGDFKKDIKLNTSKVTKASMKRLQEIVDELGETNINAIYESVKSTNSKPLLANFYLYYNFIIMPYI